MSDRLAPCRYLRQNTFSENHDRLTGLVEQTQGESMKTLALRLIVSPLLLTLLVGAAAAQRLQVDHLETLFPKAVETIDVTIDSALIRLSSKFLNNNKPEEAAIREIIQALQGIYVKGVEFDKDGEYTEHDLESIRTQLRQPGWERIVGVRSKRDGENVEVHLMMNGDLITGVGVLVWAPKQLFVVNVVGPIDPEKIGQLRGRFGLPDMDFDFSGVGARKYRKNEKN